jgi:hypothetical protein
MRRSNGRRADDMRPKMTAGGDRSTFVRPGPMAWVTWLLFESQVALLATLGTILFVLLVHWRRSGKVVPLLVGLVTSVGLLVMQGLVETRRELADRLLTPVEQETVLGQDQSLRALVAPDFRAGSMTRDAFLSWVRTRLEDRPISSLRRLEMRVVESESDRFRISNRYEIQATVGRAGVQLGYATVAFEFRKTPTGWALVDLPPPMRAGRSMAEWNSWGW